MEGILYYPHDYQAGKKYPLLPMIHGGPHGASYDSFQDRWGERANLLAQRGAFVLKPNYHGSSDCGLEWGKSISGGNYNELEWIDVEKGVDSLIAKGLVDPGRLGVLGRLHGERRRQAGSAAGRSRPRRTRNRRPRRAPTTSASASSGSRR